MSYDPKWVSLGYGIGQVLCVNEDEEAAAEAKRAEIANPDGDTDAPTIEDLQTKLDAAGIAYDKRWGAKRLAALLPKA